MKLVAKVFFCIGLLIFCMNISMDTALDYDLVDVRLLLLNISDCDTWFWSSLIFTDLFHVNLGSLQLENIKECVPKSSNCWCLLWLYSYITLTITSGSLFLPKFDKITSPNILVLTYLKYSILFSTYMFRFTEIER